MASVFTECVSELLLSIPPGRVVTYGSLAAAAGFPRAARQVAWVLHSQSRVRNLPWHRVVAAGGRIALTDPLAAKLQRELLVSEGVIIGPEGAVDLDRYLWAFE